MLLLPVFPKPAHAQNSAALTLQEAVQIALAQHPDVEKARVAADLIKGRIREVRAQAFPEVNFGATVIRWRDPSLLNPSGLDKFPEELRNALVPTSVNLLDYSVSLSPCKVETHARASEMRLTRPTTSRSPMYICDRLDRPIGGILPLVLRTESSAYRHPAEGLAVATAQRARVFALRS